MATPDKITQAISAAVLNLQSHHQPHAENALLSAYHSGMPVIVKNGDYQYHGSWKTHTTHGCPDGIRTLALGTVLVVVASERFSVEL